MSDWKEAEVRAEPGPPAIDRDEEYLRAMKELYGLELPYNLRVRPLTPADLNHFSAILSHRRLESSRNQQSGGHQDSWNETGGFH